MVGHMSARMVRYYTHISNRAVREAVALLDTSRTLFAGTFVESQDVGESNTTLLNSWWAVQDSQHYFSFTDLR